MSVQRPKAGQPGPEAIDAAIFQKPRMRAALAARDVATVYRKLQESGVTQRRIAALTGQSQSEVSEIIGGRQVISYDVLVRIADGFNLPRGWLGLAYVDSPAPTPRVPAKAKTAKKTAAKKTTEAAAGNARTPAKRPSRPKS